ncbi:NnrS family protein [Pseudooceanicola sp. HF7]|uniref:NnrS family protein n=1 Tax=Pseudooceanicola sp. HF7 TaxID=2721560 RepID=UPI001430D617|nr:NnrS family protein [Pseudooceanicola sp. HF7]NIZ10064.1 NnrS family protein [Pseudooceanicola sp. HF7]
MTPRTNYTGPALFSYGFRPFFLAATLFALLVIPAWWLIWRGAMALSGPFMPVDWHIHEMVFGYGAAVVAGFLFTAVPNWTGRLPTRGWPLVALLAVWLAGRAAVAGLAGLGALPVLLFDQLFLLTVAAMITREILAGKNWRNLKVLVPVTLLWLANVLFHVESMTQGAADMSRRFGIGLLIFLVMLIGGRILPSFTRNWLVQRGAQRLPVAFNGLDAASLLAAALALLAWTFAPFGWPCAVLAALAGALQLVRLSRWCGDQSWPSPLLLMLHLSYAAIPVGFLMIALGAAGLLGVAVGVHVFGIAAIGGMTVAVMMRATMGHTGRPLQAGRALTTAFALVFTAAIFRVAGPGVALGRFDGVDLCVVLWTAGFALLAWRIGPWLAGPKQYRKRPSKPAAGPSQVSA